MPPEAMSETASSHDAPAPSTRWDIVAAAVIAGVVAGLQVGKAPAALPAIRADLGLDLVTAGWVTSLYYAVGAILGVVIGMMADRLGPRRLALVGLALLGVGSLFGGLISSGGLLLASRFVEGVGFVGITVAAPKIIAVAARPGDRGLALGIWGIYMPLGMAIAMVVTPLLLQGLGWRGLWLANAAAIAVFAVALTWSLRPRRWPARFDAGGGFDWGGARATLGRPGPWLFGGCFVLYTLQWFAIMAWLPTFLIETQGRSAASAALYAALVVFMNVFGNLAAAWLMHRGAARWLLILVAYLVMGVTAAGIFAEFVGPQWKIPLALIFSGVGGLLPASVLAGAPAHAPGRSQVAMASGFVVQGAACGSLLGPPALAAMVGVFGGWQSSWWVMLLFPGLGLMLTIWLRAAEHKLALSTNGVAQDGI